jgi:sterol desaturase/sphingolipid hydroxylase (fatty acid hydroxylase superfamily)
MATLQISLAIFGSVLWVELIRDSYHTLCHYVPALSKGHNWHHRVFKPDLSVTDPEIYKKAHWYNDVPEAAVMLACSFLLWPIAIGMGLEYPWVVFAGSIYTTGFLLTAIGRGLGIPGVEEATDITHRQGVFNELPGNFLVNRTYHWRHHFDNQNAYFCGMFTLFDRVMGTALSLKGKKIAVTGASGTLGQALIKELSRREAKVIALTSSPQTELWDHAGNAIETIVWQIGQEAQLLTHLEKVDILLINHGINVHDRRDADAIEASYDINTFSSWRLMNLFFTTVKSNKDKARKEIWVNTSEAEVNPAFSPLYELSKRSLGDLVTLARLDAPIVVRKLILGPFKSNLNPVGIMDANWVARQILNLAQRDFRTIIVTINPLTFLLMPIKELTVGLYFRWFTKA